MIQTDQTSVSVALCLFESIKPIFTVNDMGWLYDLRMLTYLLLQDSFSWVNVKAAVKYYLMHLGWQNGAHYKLLFMSKNTDRYKSARHLKRLNTRHLVHLKCLNLKSFGLFCLTTL